MRITDFSSLKQSRFGSRLCQNRLPILCYHRIEDDPEDALAVTPGQFATQMRWIKENGYRVISLDEGLRKLERRGTLHSFVTLTFDDGNRDFIDHALPVLDEFVYPATVFVVPGKLGRMSDWHNISKPGRLMTVDDLHLLMQKGITIGSHTWSHKLLTGLPDAELRFELEESGAFLKTELKIENSSFSYPWGAFGPRECLAVIRAGYRSACGIGGFWANGYETDHFNLSRYEIHQNHSLQDFRMLVGSALKMPLMPWPWLIFYDLFKKALLTPQLENED